MTGLKEATHLKREHQDKPLFIEDIVVYTRKEDSDEEEWKENFEAKSLNDL